jgi:hypothetical protein
VARFLVAVAGVGLFMIFFKPVKTAGVFCTIFPFGVVPVDPAAAANTLLCESSSDSEAKPVLARDLIVVGSVAVARLFREDETVFASEANALTADLTLAAEGMLDAAAFPEDAPLVAAGFAAAFEVEPFAVVVPPVVAFPVEPVDDVAAL